MAQDLSLPIGGVRRSPTQQNSKYFKDVFTAALYSLLSPFRFGASSLPPPLRSLSPLKLSFIYTAFWYLVFRWVTDGLRRKPTAILGRSMLGRLHSYLLRSCSSLLGVRLPKGFEVSPSMKKDGQYLFCYHPHGAVTWTAFFFGVTWTTGNHDSPEPQQRQTMCCTADVLFRIPIVREIILLGNARVAQPRVMSECLKAGNSIALNPGGVHEQLRYRNDHEEAYFPHRLGFIRIALVHGVPLVPIYFFGENQIFRDFGQAGNRVTRWLYKNTGIGAPFVSPIPCSTDVRFVFGDVIDVGPPDPHPSNERINEVFQKYCAALLKLFNENKDAALPQEVAKKGLRIIRRAPNRPASL